MASYIVPPRFRPAKGSGDIEKHLFTWINCNLMLHITGSQEIFLFIVFLLIQDHFYSRKSSQPSPQSHVSFSHLSKLTLKNSRLSSLCVSDAHAASAPSELYSDLSAPGKASQSS